MYIEIVVSKICILSHYLKYILFYKCKFQELCTYYHNGVPC